MKETIAKVAEEVGIKVAYVCGSPDECPDDDGCCHYNKPEGRWLRPGQLEKFSRRLIEELDKQAEPVAEVVALSRLENESINATPRIIPLRSDLSVGDKLYLHHSRPVCPQCEKAIDEAAEVERNKDAERYRYLRSHTTFQDRNGPGLYWYLPRGDRWLSAADLLDEAIDEEIAAAKREGK